MSDRPPDESEAIITDFELYCEDHLEEAKEMGVDPFNTIMAAQGALLENERFFDIAYRVKNGYGLPDHLDWSGDGEEPNIPESERPDVQHINDTMREIQPVCCWLEENAEDPWEGEVGSPFIHILADFAGRRWGDD